MGEVSTIGVDIAKSVFQVHGVDADGAAVIRMFEEFMRARAEEEPELPDYPKSPEFRAKFGPATHHFWSLLGA